MLTCYHLALIRAQPYTNRLESSLTLITVGDRSEILPNWGSSGMLRGGLSLAVFQECFQPVAFSLWGAYTRTLSSIPAFGYKGNLLICDYRTFYGRSQGKREN